MRISKTQSRARGAARCAALSLTAALLCAAVPVLSSAAALERKEAADRVPWLRDATWPEVLRQATENDAPILIDFTAEWCGPCRLLDVMVFNDTDVIAELEDVVPYQVDVDDPRHAALKAVFDVQRLPTLVWCDSNGGEIDRFTGYRAAPAFLAQVAAWRGGVDTYRAARIRGQAHPADASVVLDLADRCRERGEDRRAEVLYRRLAHLADDSECGTLVAGMLGLAEVSGRLGYEKEGRQLMRRATARLDRCDVDQAEGLRRVVSCQAALGDTAGMLETWRALVDLDDRDIEALDGFARAALYQEQGLQEASEAALRAIIISDHDPRMIDTLAEIYHRMGKYRRAIKWIRKSIEQDPQEEWYRQQLARFEESLREDPWGYRGIRN